MYIKHTHIYIYIYIYIYILIKLCTNLYFPYKKDVWDRFIIGIVYIYFLFRKPIKVGSFTHNTVHYTTIHILHYITEHIVQYSTCNTVQYSTKQYVTV